MSVNTYCTDDLKYSLKGGYDGSNLPPSRPVRVLYAYGNVDAEGACCNDCGGEWDGGFVVELESGKICHATGWADYTGWGCQDGGAHTLHDKIEDIPVMPFWDKDPIDLNSELPEIWKSLMEEES